ncbi:MAG: prepilin-type N-terminal cleavage/methylation domain-containing protein [Candidatus Brennerbacteria bacterium]|nr:prepilin-type N-terminal cleavage/methylation domain-containing protein [Candidatus Brennerbacteria bacterium]
MNQKQIKGFTLIELIITISILAILIAIVVVALNPAEQLQRSRDTKRVADLDAIKTALNLYLAQATTTVNMSGAGTANQNCIGGGGTPSLYVNTTGAPTLQSGNLTALVTSTNQTVGSAGWLGARIDQTPGGAPLASLPLDPTNGAGALTTFYYGYGCRASNNTFEITARLESNFYKTDLDQDGTDGGNSTSTYEVGTDLTIVQNGN